MGEKPSQRRLARERAVQMLYGSAMTGYDPDAAIARFWETTPARPGVRTYAEILVRGVAENRETLDERIRRVSDAWPYQRIGHIERAVMQVALYELLYCGDVPDAVAINEALEIEKRFGHEDAVPFVHALLDRVRREHAESATGGQNG